MSNSGSRQASSQRAGGPPESTGTPAAPAASTSRTVRIAGGAPESMATLAVQHIAARTRKTASARRRGVWGVRSIPQLKERARDSLSRERWGVWGVRSIPQLKERARDSLSRERKTRPCLALCSLDHHRHPLAAADAEAGQAPPQPARPQGVEKRDEDTGAGGADGMAERDRAAVDVDLGRVQLQLAPHGQ